MAAEAPPKYRQIADDIRLRIRTGRYQPGSQLPSKADLMGEYTVALGTLNDAFRVLRDEELIRTVQGSGTYVCDPLPDEHPESEYDVVMRRLDELGEASGAGELDALRETVTELRQRSEGYADLETTVSRLESNLRDLYAKQGFVYPDAGHGSEKRDKAVGHG